jgi:predicted RNA-binding Zn-ribbon protein involved in translation (DUF1610 family)
MAKNQDKGTGKSDETGRIFPTTNEEWTAVAEVMGATQAAVIIEYLRSQGIPAYQTGADNALSFNVGALGTAYIMVPDTYLVEARFLLKAEETTGSSDFDASEGASYSGVTKALLGASALIVNPVGTGIAVAIAYLSGSGDELRYGTQCPQCSTDLELNEAETSEGWFVCPECGETVGLEFHLSCPNCRTELALAAEEKRQGWYVCPECGQKDRINSNEKDTDSVLVNDDDLNEKKDFQFETLCLNCESELFLDETEYAQGWYVCPVCNEIIDLEIQLPCANCDTVLVLDDNERLQGWCICSECGQKSSMDGNKIDAELDSIDSFEFKSNVSQFEAHCLHCDTILNLSKAEIAQGWYECPVCNEITDLRIQIPCANCEIMLDLDEEERQRGWYICPACGQKADIL